MKYLPQSLLIICFFISAQAQSATVTSLTNQTPINFGKIAPGNSTGNIASPCTATSAKILSGCTNGSIVISATNNHVNRAKPKEKDNGRKIKIFLTNSPTTLSSGTNSINSDTAIAAITIQTGCTQVSVGVLECKNPSDAVGNVKTWTIPILGNLNNISSTQASGNYSGNYSIVACSCCSDNGVPNLCATQGCPGIATEARCTEFGKSLSSNIPARIITPLSATETSALRFGGVAAGATSGTVNQSGAVTGGVTAIASTSSNPRSAGSYSVTGEPSTSYSFTFPATISLTSSGKPSMNVALSYASGDSGRSLNSSGSEVVNINGILTVGASQPSGVYSATYTINLNY
jgi:hypothetical protein